MHRQILIVDDEPAIRHLIVEFLTSDGYAVQPAADGHAALDLFAHDPPDLVITDVMMPCCEGLSMLQTLRCAGRTLPVVLMSAAPLRQGLVGAPVIPKPFDIEALLEQGLHQLAITYR